MKWVDSKRFKELEKIFKGVANKRRIQVVELLYRRPELSLIEIAEELDVDIKLLSEHVRKLVYAGLVIKRHDGNFVRHRLTDRGKAIQQFYRIVE